MNINQYYLDAINGGLKEENELFQKLFEIFRAIAYQSIRNKEDADDVAQSSLMRVAGKYKNMAFDLSFSAYAYKILTNSIAGYFQKLKRTNELSDPRRPEEIMGVGWSSEPIFEQKLLDCLKNIYGANLRYARILCLKYQGFHVNEICQRLNISANNLYIILSRARSMLKKCLEETGAL